MTTQEAIETIKTAIAEVEWEYPMDYAVAFDMAIEALSCSEKPNESDLISRQDAIEELEHMLSEPQYQHTGEDWFVGVSCAQSKIYELPSAQTDLSEYSDKLYKSGYENGKRDAQTEPVIRITGTRKHVSDFSELDEPEQRWIPVSKETNPKKSGWYLVTCSEEITAENKRFSGMAEYDATIGEWFDADEPTDCYLAWQNMPEPYMGDES